MKKLLFALALLAPAAFADSEFSVVLQGGASHYEQSLSGTDTGAAYGARIGFLPTPIIGLEVGYLGSQNNVSSSINAGSDQSTLMTNEAYGDVRVNIFPWHVTPYVFGGFGSTWVSGGEASGIPNNRANTVPFGAGLEANLGAFKVGARFQYNYLFENIYTGSNASGTPTSAAVDKGGNTDFWTASIDLGASFR
jgi:hypothetical protein